MNLSYLSVKNFRGIRDSRIPLSSFVCLIGQNNSGKSSLLLALRLFQSGTALPKSDYFDETQDIRIEVDLEQISKADLQRIAPEHRQRIGEIIRDEKLTLVRVYGQDGKSKLLYKASVPKDCRFTPDEIGKLVSKQKPGEAFATKVAEAFPEIKDEVTRSMNQGEVKALIQGLVDDMPSEDLKEEDRPLPTGIDSSIKSLLPEPIYIPAVKDLADDTKTKESATFGKVLGILLDQIKDKLESTETLFEQLNTQLNRVEMDDGTIVDERLPEVKAIEYAVEHYIRESFSNVSVRIRIPPPEIKTILQNAQIYADDGVDGLIETKGDGLRRAMVFSILRSYVEIRQSHEAAQSVAVANGAGDGEIETPQTQYLLLFEEPELYLHPQAQLVLFDALKEFAKEHAVVVTTHSPAFFGPDATDTFVKLKKTSKKGVSKPFTHAIPIDLGGISERDQFQIICYENNNAAFFADRVVLVEGPSDYLVFPHVAKLLNPDWNPARSPIRFARAGGKSSIRKYRNFFGRFGSNVVVITDLDILIDGFDQLGSDDDLVQLRAQLISDIDAISAANGDPDEITQREIKKARDSGELRSRCVAMLRACRGVVDGTTTNEEAQVAAEAFFAYERKNDRLAILQDCTDQALLVKKHALLTGLRRQGVFVLDRGAIEDYYPETISGGDKASRSQQFCKAITNREQVLACCGNLPDGDNGDRNEFELIFETIFNGKTIGTEQEPAGEQINAAASDKAEDPTGTIDT